MLPLTRDHAWSRFNSCMTNPPKPSPQSIASALRAHVAANPGAVIVASYPTAFESWFRAEIALVLIQLGYSRSNLDFRYEYPVSGGTQRKYADLAFRGDWPVVFELKPFVNHADSNKKTTFPTQLALLENHVASRHIAAGVAFATFFGYSSNQVHARIRSLFNARWTVSGPHLLLVEHPLEFVVAVI